MRILAIETPEDKLAMLAILRGAKWHHYPHLLIILSF